jgi:hypothetical protein
VEEADLNADEAEPEKLPAQIDKAEKSVEAVEDAIANQLPNNKVGDLGKEVMSDVKTVERKIIDEGVGQEVAGLVAEDLTQAEPCKSVASCLHVLTMSGILFLISIGAYSSCMFEKKLTNMEYPPKAEEFTGDMNPVPLSFCPGGVGSLLCFASYCCCCCLRMEVFGKLEKWETSTKKKQVVLFSLLMLIGHVVVVFLTILLGVPEKYVHLAGVGSLLLFPFGMTFLGLQMAGKRMELKNVKKSTKEQSYGVELAVSACLCPCAVGQEVEFMEKYEATFKETAW